MAKQSNTIIYLTIGAVILYLYLKKKPINIPSISPDLPITKSSPGMPSSYGITTPKGKIIEDGYDPSVYSAPVMKDTPQNAKDYTPGEFQPGPVDVAPVDPIYLTDFATNSDDTGTPAPPYSYPENIFQDDLFFPSKPTDPFSVNRLPSTGLQQLTPSYATIKDISNPVFNTMDYNCVDCNQNKLSGYYRPMPNIC